MTADKRNIAETFNSYFINLAKNLTTSADNGNCKQNIYLPIPENKSIFLKPASLSEVRTTFNNLKNSNSCGHDNISTKIVKMSSQYIALPIQHILNHCFKTGRFPDTLKIAKVICLHKKGDTSLPSNYRPISILSVFSKIFERLLANRIICFLENNCILHKYQHGFRENRSTSTALSNILHYIYSNMDSGNKVIALFLDLSKAFDCVDHGVLLLKLEHYGLRGPCLEMLKSYLTNRYQFVECSGVKSRKLPLEAGVPQGSVLGPLLFLLYINDIHEHISTYFCAFADDVTLLCSCKSIEEVAYHLTTNLTMLSQYFCNNMLVLNKDKTFCLQFNFSKQIINKSPLI